MDNVLAQRRLIREAFGISILALVVGRSMGAQIAFQWGSAFPDEVATLLPFVGSARTSPHNKVFLATVRRAITSDPAWNGGDYETQPVAGLDHMQLVFDAWGLSQAWYREGLFRSSGFADVSDFLKRPRPASGADANDLIAQLDTWYDADIAANGRFGGDFAAALRAISMPAIVMPSRTDLYFPPEDSAVEAAMMPMAELRVIESIWGHRAGAPGTAKEDIRFIETAIAELLSVTK